MEIVYNELEQKATIFLDVKPYITKIDMALHPIYDSRFFYFISKSIKCN